MSDIKKISKLPENEMVLFKPVVWGSWNRQEPKSEYHIFIPTRIEVGRVLGRVFGYNYYVNKNLVRLDRWYRGDKWWLVEITNPDKARELDLFIKTLPEYISQEIKEYFNGT